LICSILRARVPRALSVLAAVTLLLSVAAPGLARGKAGPSPWPDVAIGAVDPDVLGLALEAVECASRAGSVSAPRTLTVIDFSRPSTEKRLWVYDLNARRLLYEELVSHGQGSGGDLATRFSNEPESHQSSLGLFVTAETYVGRNGYSLRLDGLEPGVNDRARERAIVMHGAPYVSDDAIRSLGRLGRSWGCPAVRPEITRELLDGVREGSLLFAYYPDEDWLRTSRYLGACAAASAPGPVTRP